jgi:hypothetical protein
MIDAIGHLATVVVVISFLMKDIRKLRLLSMTGSAIFLIYGFILMLWPVIIINVLLILVNLRALIYLKMGIDEQTEKTT